jgi:hypothetical protein
MRLPLSKAQMLQLIDNSRAQSVAIHNNCIRFPCCNDRNDLSRKKHLFVLLITTSQKKNDSAISQIRRTNGDANPGRIP